MERITRSNKIMDILPKASSSKRGRKKKNGENQVAEATMQQPQNIRRSLRGRNTDNNSQSQTEFSESKSMLDNSTDENVSLEITLSPLKSDIQPDDTTCPSITTLESSMSQCDLLDDKKHPIVVLQQLSESDISPKKESLNATRIIATDENIVDVQLKSIDEPMEIATIAESEENTIKSPTEMESSSTTVVCEEPPQLDKTVEIKEEPKYEQLVFVDEKIEDVSYLRRSRRLKSVFQETHIPQDTSSLLNDEPIIVPKIEQALPSSLVQPEEKIVEIKKEVKLEPTHLKMEGNILEEESIDVLSDVRLSQFITIKENIYLKPSDKIICKINKTMKCDCTLTEMDIKNQELGCTFNCINRLLYIECSPKCRCGEFCDNQQFQRCNYSPISVFKTEKKGFGIRADADILPETFIIEYVGEVLNNKQFEKRATKYSKDKNRHYYFMALRSNAIIDATVKGNISRFINHSCDPNAITQKWTINGELRVGFFSVRFIKKGEEITFDYQFQRYGKEAQKCFCESENCRGWIGENPDSGDEVETEGSKEKKGAKSKKVSTATKAKLKSKSTENEEILSSESHLVDKESSKRSVDTVVPKPERKAKKLFEDLEIEEQIQDLIKSGLKNRVHTIALARLVVRAKSVESRSSLLKILIAGELPCRRLFLDYNGLRLLHNWMCDVNVKNSTLDLKLCDELLNALSILPITNKTVLRDSKVLERVEKWKNLDIDKKKLSKEEKKQAKAIKKKNKKIPNVEQEEQQQQNEIQDECSVSATTSFDVLEELPIMKLIVKEKAAALLQKWEILKEDFRIPKKQKQVNRKEHEKEAGMEDELWQNEQKSSSTVMSERTKSYRDTTSNNRSVPFQASYKRHSVDLLERQHRRQEFEKRMEQIEFEKRMVIEHHNNCAMLGLMNDTDPMAIPVRVNRVTGEYGNLFGEKVPPPPFHPDYDYKFKPLSLSTNPDDYHLPPIDLPEHWRFAIDKSGHIYYYHEKIRISQWEAPIKILPIFSMEEDDLEQGIAGEEYENLGLPENDESSTDTEDSEEEELRELLEMLKRKKRKLNSKLDFDEQTIPADISAVEEDLEKKIKLNSNITKPLESTVKISAIEEDVNKTKRKRRRGLVTMMKFIRPRTEEDKLYGRNESKRYKEVKEKLRRKKKRRLQGDGDINRCSDDDEDNCEDDDEDELTGDTSFSGKMVDELDILAKSKHLDKIRKIKADIEIGRNQPVDRNKKQSARPMPPTDQNLIKRQFRDDIKEEIAKYLLPYRSESCTNGRIVSEEDYHGLINKLTYSVLTKESKHCALSNSMLKATDSVKGKTKEFIKKYMSKFEGPYQRKTEEQDYSLILNKY